MFDKLRTFAAHLPRRQKNAIMLAFDFVVLSTAVWVAYSLRLSTIRFPDPVEWFVILTAPATAIPVFIRMGLYRAVIRYLPERAFWTIASSVGLATLAWVAVLFMLEISRLGTVPRSVPIIYAILAILVIGGSRFLAKAFLWSPFRAARSGTVAIYGAGASGTQLANALHEEHQKFVGAFLDDDPALHGMEIGGTRIYPPGELATLIKQLGIQEVIICMPSLSAAKRQNIITDLSTHGVPIRSLPPLKDLASGRVLISQLHEVDIGDILGRSSVPADPELLDTMLNGRSILVTGAGGSIGSELCELIARWSPRKLILLEASEFMLYQIERKLKKQYDIPIVPILGSVSDEALVSRIFSTEAIQAVFHAAAHKHVPLVEANALEGVRNNVFGTRTIARAAYEAGVEHFVLISSDKAVRPANVMGATKRWAELVIGQLARRAIAEETGQKFCSVRFGNVLASNGSVVPLFKEQIAQGGPVTITDNEMTRYFMSIHEAAELIVQAGALSQGGDTFILEMGEPMRIRDLAENMIRLSGATVRSEENPGGDIAITVIGRRPAEKLAEELFYDPESVRPTRFPKILRAPGDRRVNEQLNTELEKLARALREQNEVELRKILFEFLARRQPGTGDAKIVPISRAKDAGA